MINDRIRQLLARYYDGVSTPEETKELKDFFCQAKNVPEDLGADAAIFKAMAQIEAKECKVPENLKERIIASTTGRRRPSFSWRSAISVAASLAVLIALGVALTMGNRDAESADLFLATNTYETAENYREVVDSAEVVAITSQLFAMLEHSLDKADNGARYAESAIEVISDPLNKRFKN